MRKTDIKEFGNLLESLEKAGWQPQLCDTEVPRFDASVPCGNPLMCSGDLEEKVLLPRELLSMNPEFMVSVRGDSMIDAGIETGDVVKVECSVTPRDGDIVLACIDGSYTLKAYYEDDEGQQWLVPQNENYEPILLEEKDNVRILGHVKEVVRQAPRVAGRLCNSCDCILHLQNTAFSDANAR